MEELKGTEKQIKFAKTIIKDMKNVIAIATEKRLQKESEKFDKFDKNKKEQYGTKEKYIKLRKDMMQEAEEKLFSNNNASYYINQFKEILQENKLTEKAEIIRSNDGKSGVGVTLRYLFF